MTTSAVSGDNVTATERAMPAVLRAAIVKQIEDLSFRYGRSATKDAEMVTSTIEELLTAHPDAESLRALLGWWLRQFEEQGIEPCFCVYHGETGERTPNPHCPHHREVEPDMSPVARRRRIAEAARRQVEGGRIGRIGPSDV